MKIIILLAVVALLLFLTRSKKATLEVALEALDSGPLSRNENLAGYTDVEVPGGEKIRFVNGRISIFYILSRSPDSRTIETIDFVIRGYEGGYKVTFIDDEVVRWTHNSADFPASLVNPEKSVLAHKVLEEVRAAYRSK